MSKPKRQHFLPIFYLKNFCEKGIFWIYDRNKNEYRKQTPKNTGILKKYYNFKESNSKECYGIENKVLSDIETETKPIIDKIHNKKMISLHEKIILTIFISFLRFRVPCFEKEHNYIIDKFLKTYYKIYFSSKENRQKIVEQFTNNNEGKQSYSESFFNFIEEERYQITPHRVWSLKSMLSMIEPFSEALILMDWKFCYACKTELFVTSDNPFILIPSINYREGELGRWSIYSPGNEKIVPLTPKVCLIISDKGEKIKQVSISLEKVKIINSNIAKNCDNLLISEDKGLLEELVKITNINNFKEKTKVKVEVIRNGEFIITRKK